MHSFNQLNRYYQSDQDSFMASRLIKLFTIAAPRFIGLARGRRLRPIIDRNDMAAGNRFMSNVTLVDQVTEALEAYFTEVSPEDVPLSERNLSERLGVSRPIVREALAGFRHRGLVKIVPGKGIYPIRNYRQPALAAMRDYLSRSNLSFSALLGGRRFLEVHIVGAAASERTADDIAQLKAAMSLMEKSVNDPESFEGADLAFHIALAEAAHNELYVIWLKPIIGALENRRNRVVTLGEVRTRVLEGHLAILEAVERGDVEGARRAMDAHLDMFESDTRLAVSLGLLPPEDGEG